MDITWAAFFLRHSPVSTSAKPACMNRAKKPQIKIQTMFVAYASSERVGSITASPCSRPHTMRTVVRCLLENFGQFAGSSGELPRISSEVWARRRLSVDGEPKTVDNPLRVFPRTRIGNRTRLRLVERARAARGTSARDVAKISADQDALRSVSAHEVHLHRAGLDPARQRVPVA